MLKIRRCLVLTTILCTFTDFFSNAQAQWVSPPIVDQCGYREARCKRDSAGNIVDKKTGDVYDRKGNLLRRGNGNIISQKKRCKYITTNNCSLYNINCRSNWHWKCD
jgi:hypothetical protein